MMQIEVARKMIGTPYMHQGRLPGVGLDCIGLVIAVAKAVGIEPIDQRRYGRIPDGKTLKDALDTHLVERESIEDMEPGDVILMNFRDGHAPQHVAVFTGKTIIHSYSGSKRVVEHDLDDVWRKRILSVYGWPL